MNDTNIDTLTKRLKIQKKLTDYYRMLYLKEHTMANNIVSQLIDKKLGALHTRDGVVCADITEYRKSYHMWDNAFTELRKEITAMVDALPKME